jgi:chemotaxis protein MotB
MEDQPRPAPEWTVTYADMMSLVLTFFVMLVSMSEIKEDEKFQAMVDSMRQEFGPNATSAPALGKRVPRNSNMIHTASAGRARRRDAIAAGESVKALRDDPTAGPRRKGSGPISICELHFSEGASTLAGPAMRRLQEVVDQMAGNTLRVEIRGHASRRPLTPDSTMRDTWDLAYERCWEVMRFLADRGIDPARMRFEVAGENEPRYFGADVQLQQRNDRVEVRLWSHVANMTE